MKNKYMLWKLPNNYPVRLHKQVIEACCSYKMITKDWVSAVFDVIFNFYLTLVIITLAVVRFTTEVVLNSLEKILWLIV